MEENDKDFLRKNIRKIREIRKEKMLPSEWAMKNRILSPSDSSIPGYWSPKYLPYVTEILDSFHESDPVQNVVVCKAAQTGFSVSCLENQILYTIAENPKPSMMVFSTLEALRMRTKIALEPAIQTSGLDKYLHSSINDPKNKRTGNSTFLKEFRNGFLILGSFANRGVLRSFSISRLWLDEVDSADLKSGKEGDPITNLVSRTSAWGRKSKIYYISTPNLISTSKIWELYLRGDQRKYLVPCPHCNYNHSLEVENFRYELDEDKIIIPKSVRFLCPKCQKDIYEYSKQTMLESGFWEPTAKAKSRNFKSYHLSAFYSPTFFQSWETIALKHHQALEQERELGDTSLIENFTKLQLGLPYEEKEEQSLNPQILYNSKRQDYYYTSGNTDLPEEILFCTAGADVQGDRIECEILGWGKHGTSWSIDYQIFKLPTFQDQFLAFCDFLSMPRSTTSGRNLIVSQALIDCGFKTEEVIISCSQIEGIYPCMGFADSRQSRQLIVKTKIKTLNNSYRLDLNVNTLKDIFFRNLGKVANYEKPLSGACFFPENYGEDYYKQLVSEKKIKKKITGKNRISTQYVAIRKKNEALDCRIYNLAAFYNILYTVCTDVLRLSGVDYDKFWNYAESEAGIIQMEDENKKDEK